MKKNFFNIFVLFCFLCICFGCNENKTNTNKIVIWHWMTDRDDAFIELANKYKNLTGVDVSFELYAPSEAYSSKVKAAAQTNTLPDVFSILGAKRDLASFINAGHVANLTSYMEENNNEWKDQFIPTSIEINEFKEGNPFDVEPGIYGVSIDFSSIQFLYNKTMFRNAGLDPENPPRTWNEFIDANKKLRAKGYQGIVGGFGEIWFLDCLTTIYAYNILGEEKFISTVKGETPYTDPDWVKVLSLFEELSKNNCFATGTISMINKTSEQTFANEKAAINYNGSWAVNVYSGMNPTLEYGVMAPPVYNSKRPMYVWGGNGSSFMVNEKSKHKEEVIKFLKWFTAVEQQNFLTDVTKNIPSNKNSLEYVDGVLKDFAKTSDNFITSWKYNIFEYPSVLEVLDKGIQSIIIGEKTPISVLQEVEQVKQKEMENF